MVRAVPAHLVVLIAAAASAPPASAATVIETGSYTAGQDTTVFGTTAGQGVSTGVGRYRFTFTVTTPLDYLFGDIIKTDFYNEFADFHDGNGFVYVGGDDTPEYHSLMQSGPFTYTTDITVNPNTSSTSDVPGYATFLTITGEDCCGYQLDFLSQASGTYTLSVSAVPEPASWTLMIAGLGLVGATMRRSRPTVAWRNA